ncbi:hypothetical protein BDY19DRAFT_989369 [Irpex rosettiformis]|uniref:Uncharacterized protein n=1 Tax=Irpex rosettiformis TaxID=378272 RepID=A0ACB8UJK6_9APHY|nr:hypothetical protein BDY19DRAFT_989369 [Irpex rosettiformis]
MPPHKPNAPQPQRLTLTTTSLRNVILSNKSDVIYYEVITPKWARGVTTISRLDPNTRQYDIVGEMKNDAKGHAAEVKMWGGASQPADTFLVKGDEARRSTFHGKDGKRYTWRASSKRLELRRDDMPEDKPVAVYYKEKRYAYALKMSRLPYLEVDPVVMDTLDSLIMSFLLIERRRRKKDV